jgi:hypothetical protein
MQSVAWSFLTNHARVLLCITEDPSVRLREVAERVGVTERAAHRIISDLVAAGYVSRERIGRRNHYTVRRDLPLPDPLSRTRPLGELLAILTPDANEDAITPDANEDAFTPQPRRRSAVAGQPARGRRG